MHLILALAIASSPTWDTSNVVGHEIYDDSGTMKRTLLDDWLDAGDGGDYAKAIERFQQECDDIVPGAGTLTRGCTLQLACGKQYELASTVDVCSNLRIVGCGTPFNASSGFKMKTNAESDAFRVWHRNETCPISMHSDINPYLSLENVSIYNYDVTLTNKIAGIRNRAMMNLENVEIYGFVQGINEVCSATSSGCNLTQARNVWLRYNLHAGWFREGADTNAGVMTGVNATANCRAANDWNATLEPVYCTEQAHLNEEVCLDSSYDCAGIMSFSFLGDTWIGPHTSTTKDVDAVPNKTYPGMILGHINAFNTAIGPYSETDEAPSYIAQSSIAIGGHWQFKPMDNAGLVIKGNVFNTAVFRNDKDGQADVKLGRAQNLADSFITMDNDEDNWPLRITYNDDTDVSGNKDTFEISVNGTDAIKIGDEHSGGGGGELVLKDTAYINGACWEFDTATHACD